MNKLTLFFGIAIVFILGVFWVNFQGKIAQERCLMSGGQWSKADKSCNG